MIKRLLLALALTATVSASAQQLETVTVNGKSRTMMVYKPKTLGEGRPLVISLHGANQDAAYQRDQTKWNNCADTANILVVYPNAINKFWDTGGSSDIAFISWIIDEMHDRHQIDLNRVYVSGFSLGAMMTYHCIEHLGNRVAAFAPVSGVCFDNRKPKAPRRVPIIHTHGTGDDVFKWTGDPGHAAGGYPYIPDYVESWATYEGLTEREDISPYPSTKRNSNASLTVWHSADPGDDIEVALLALKDKGHWHSEDIAGGVSTTQEIWRFCKRYSLQPVAPEVAKVEPEDLSFDLQPSDGSFVFTLTDVADISTISATMTSGDVTIPLALAETENAKVLNFSVPETATVVEGMYQLVLSGIKNPEGGKDRSETFTYYYGPSEYGDRIKADFRQVYDYACELYERSEGATAMSVVNARARLKKYIDKYVDFVSTSPSAYAKATENLTKNFEVVEKYLDTVGIAAVGSDADVIGTRYYSVDGVEVPAPLPGLTIAVTRLADGTTRLSKLLR